MKPIIASFLIVFSIVNHTMAQTGKIQSDRNSTNFGIFLKGFITNAFSGKNFDSLAQHQSPVVMDYVHKDLGLGRFYNMGVYCNLYEGKDLGYDNSPGFAQKQPYISWMKFRANKLPNDGFCDPSKSPNGIYYKETQDLPRDWDMEDSKAKPMPEKFKSLKKMTVYILYDKYVIKSLYFVLYKGKWNLIYINDCDCSA